MTFSSLLRLVPRYRQLNDYRLEKSTVQNFTDGFLKTKWENIEKNYSRFLKGRGEVVIAGILILREVRV